MKLNAPQQFSINNTHALRHAGPLSRSRRVTGAQTARAVSQAVIERVRVAEKISVAELNKTLEARSKALIALEEEEVHTRPKVRISFQCKVGLGDVWKITGQAPELGRWNPEISPRMVWNNGDVWVFESRIRPGTFTYKAVLRAADGAYIYEEGPDHVLEVGPGLGPDNVIEVKLSPKLPIRG